MVQPPPLADWPPAKSVPPVGPEVTGGSQPGFIADGWRALLSRINGEEGASYLMSLVVHLVLLCLLALIPAIGLTALPQSLTTILGGGDDHGGVGNAIDTALSSPMAAGDPLDAQWLAQQTGGENALSDFNPAALAVMRPGGGAGGEFGDGVSGIRIPNPENAVRVGSFTVWAWPIAGKDLKGTILHDTPGGAPRANQDYHVVIRVRVPANTRSVKLSDFRGSIEGTDGYRQKIPDAAYYYNAKGELVSVRSGRNLPVVDGTVELLIEVPGAKTALIEDTIKVVSEILNEEQEIKLTFQPR